MTKSCIINLPFLVNPQLQRRNKGMQLGMQLLLKTKETNTPNRKTFIITLYKIHIST